MTITDVRPQKTKRNSWSLCDFATIFRSAVLAAMCDEITPLEGIPSPSLFNTTLCLLFLRPGIHYSEWGLFFTWKKITTWKKKSLEKKILHLKKIISWKKSIRKVLMRNRGGKFQVCTDVKPWWKRTGPLNPRRFHHGSRPLRPPIVDRSKFLLSLLINISSSI